MRLININTPNGLTCAVGTAAIMIANKYYDDERYVENKDIIAASFTKNIYEACATIVDETESRVWLVEHAGGDKYAVYYVI